LYVLLVCPHSPRWPTPTCYSSALILLVGQHLVPVARRPSFFMLAYCSYIGRNTVLGIGGLHLVRIARLSSFAVLIYSYSLLVCPHSPCWPISHTGCSSALILHTGLLLVHVAHLPSFSLLASISYALLVCPHLPRWPTGTRCSSALILLVGQYLIPVAHRP